MEGLLNETRDGRQWTLPELNREKRKAEGKVKGEEVRFSDIIQTYNISAKGEK